MRMSDGGKIDSRFPRNALVLAAANAFNGSAAPIAVTLGGLAGSYLLGPDKSLTTLPVTALNLGVAAAAIPAAALMRRVGRRKGFMTGALFAIAGGLVASFAITIGSFWLFVFSLFVVGISGAFLFQYRFAAGESADPADRAKAISWVLAGGIVSSVLGPQTVIFARNPLSPIPFAGAFLGLSALTVIGLAILNFLVEPPRSQPGSEGEAAATGRPLASIARQPKFIVAALCGMLSFGTMSLVMTAAPLAMISCGLTTNDAALGIQWHVMGMFAPSFFTGTLIVRFGKEPIMIVGLALLAACATIALAGLTVVHFWTALILLGIGWNFTFVGATTLLADTYRSEERSRVEGLNDFLVFGTVAVASFSSGSLVTSGGWNWVNYAVFPVILVCLLSLSYLAALRRRTS
jgi:MFS family permease